MSSALANQLRAIASLDADRITSHHGAPVGKSYLFPPKVAASHDNNSIFNIAISGFEELVQVEPDMLEFEEDFFSDASRTVDRMLLTAEENERLDVKLNRCILKLGKWVSLKATSKCIEWLVRRFR
jgi:U3 small nucleolar RNA-associated protein 10